MFRLSCFETSILDCFSQSKSLNFPQGLHRQHQKPCDKRTCVLCIFSRTVNYRLIFIFVFTWYESGVKKYISCFCRKIYLKTVFLIPLTRRYFPHFDRWSEHWITSLPAFLLEKHACTNFAHWYVEHILQPALLVLQVRFYCSLFCMYLGRGGVTRPHSVSLV